MDIKDEIFRFTSSPFPAYVSLTMVIETTIEGGQTAEWLMVTAVFWMIYGVSNYLHEGIEDQVEEMHDAFEEMEEEFEEMNE